MEQKLKQDIQIGETIRSLRMERKLTQDQVVSKLQLMDLTSPGASTLRSKAVPTASASRSLLVCPRSFRWTITPSFGMSISQVQNNSSPQIFPLSLRSDRGTYSSRFRTKLHGFAIVP